MREAVPLGGPWHTRGKNTLHIYGLPLHRGIKNAAKQKPGIREAETWLLRNSLESRLKSAQAWQGGPTTKTAARGVNNWSAPTVTLPKWKNGKPTTLNVGLPLKRTLFCCWSDVWHGRSAILAIEAPPSLARAAFEPRRGFLRWRVTASGFEDPGCPYLKKVRPDLGGDPAAREPGLGTGRGGDVTGSANSFSSQRAETMAGDLRGSSSETQTFGSDCDWRFTKR